MCLVHRTVGLNLEFSSPGFSMSTWQRWCLRPGPWPQGTRPGLSDEMWFFAITQRGARVWGINQVSSFAYFLLGGFSTWKPPKDVQQLLQKKHFSEDLFFWLIPKTVCVCVIFLIYQYAPPQKLGIRVFSSEVLQKAFLTNKQVALSRSPTEFTEKWKGFNRMSRDGS